MTNLSESQACPRRLYELYSLRWRIENIFKLCKSGTALKKMAAHRTNQHHAELLIWSWILKMVLLSAGGIFQLWDEVGGTVEVSIFKAIDRILQWFAMEIELAHAGSFRELKRRFLAQQKYHNCYEKRGRKSIPDRFKIALDLELEDSLG